MFFLFRYNKDGIPQGLIKFHDLLVEDTVAYFEKGKAIRKRIKDTSKAVNKAIKLANKKKRNPGVMLGTAHKALQGLYSEVEYTRKALKAINDNMEKALKQIEQERIKEPLSLLEKARACFERKDMEKGITLLKESKEKAEKKQLLKTRTALFCGISDEVKDLKHEMDGRRKKNHPPTMDTEPNKLDPQEPEPSKAFVVHGKKMRSGAHSPSAAIATIEADS
jgi:hypothetical protein